MANGYQEVTGEDLRGLSEAINKLIDQLGGKGSSSSSSSSSKSKLSKEQEEAVKRAKEHNEQLRQNTKQYKEHEKTVSKDNQAVADSLKVTRDMTDANKKYIREHGGVMKNMSLFASELPTNIAGSMNKNFADKLGPAGSAFEVLSKKTPKVAAGIAGLGLAVGFLAGKTHNVIDSFKDVSVSGVNLTGGLAGLIGSSSSLNMSLDQFAEMTTAHARTINIYGMKQFQKSANQMSRDMRGLGLTTSESADFLADYLEMQRISGHLSGLTATQQMLGAKKLMEQTDKLSQAFGVSREEILSGLKRTFDDPKVQAMVSRMPAEQAEAFKSATSTLQATMPSLVGNMAEMFSSEAPTVSRAFQDLVATGAPGIANAMLNITEGIKNGLSGAELDAAMKDLRHQLADVDIQHLTILADNGNQAAQSMVEMYNQANRSIEQEEKRQERLAKIAEEQGISIEQAIKNEEQRIAQQRQSSAAVQEAMQTFSTMGDKVFAGILEGIDVEEFVNDLTTALESLGKFVVNTLVPVFNTFAKGIGWITEHVDWKLIALGLGALVGKKLFDMISGGTKLIRANTVIVSGGGTGTGTGMGDYYGDDNKKKNRKGKSRFRKPNIKGPGAIGAIMTAANVASIATDDTMSDSEKTVGYSAAAGAGIGSVIGGIAGSFLGPVGTMVGMSVGGAVGDWLGGAIGGWLADDDPKDAVKTQKDKKMGSSMDRTLEWQNEEQAAKQEALTQEQINRRNNDIEASLAMKQSLDDLSNLSREQLDLLVLQNYLIDTGNATTKGMSKHLKTSGDDF